MGMPLIDEPAEQVMGNEPEGVGDDDAPPSESEGAESESSWFDRQLRRIGRWFEDQEDAPSAEDGEDGGGDRATTETEAAPATITLTQAELDEKIARASQAEADRREAKRAREREQKDTSDRSAVEWDRIQKLADAGDVWALGEIKAQEVKAKQERDEADRRYAETFVRTAPAWDAAYLDPLLSTLPEDVWKPIVGDGLTTLDDRKGAVEKAIKAHRDAAVADALTDQTFVRDLLLSPAFRGAFLKSDAVRKQFLALTRNDEDYDEPDAPAGVDAGRLSGDESADMNALIRARAGHVVSTRAQRRRERGNRDLIER